MVTSATQTGSTTGTTTSTTSGANPYNLTPEDFINLMVTQLKNQDPTQPTSNQELLSQMSDIGQLESSTSLQTTMKSVNLQTQVSSGAALIGKTVTGVDTTNTTTTGAVSSISVSGTDVTLKLDSGSSMLLSNLSSIGDAGATTGTKSN